jgi:hypothetical protein
MDLEMEKFYVKKIDYSIFTEAFQREVIPDNRINLANILPHRFVFYDGKNLPSGFFFTYYGFIHNRYYENPHIKDLLLVHEFTHNHLFTRLPSKNYVEWSDKMIRDEFDASIASEMSVYFSKKDHRGWIVKNNFRKETFTHRILVDNILIYDIERFKDLRNKAIDCPRGFIEEQIQNYQKSNRYWCSLYARHYRIVEEFNIDMKNKTMNNKVSDTELLMFFCENIERIVKLTLDPILKFEEYYKEVNEIYGNHLFSL